MLIVRKQVLPQVGSLLRGGIAALAQGVTLPFLPACASIVCGSSLFS